MGRTYPTITRRRWLRVRPAAAGDFGGPLRRLSFVATRPCGLACHGLRRAAAAFARRRLLRLQRFAGGQTPLPRPCPVPPPEKGAPARASHRSRVVARKAIRSGPSGRPCGPPRRPRDSAASARSCRSPPPAGPHAARPSALGGGPPLFVGIRSGRKGVAGTPAPPAWRRTAGDSGAPYPALRGPGFLARALADRRQSRRFPCQPARTRANARPR